MAIKFNEGLFELNFGVSCGPTGRYLNTYGKLIGWARSLMPGEPRPPITNEVQLNIPHCSARCLVSEGNDVTGSGSQPAAVFYCNKNY